MIIDTFLFNKDFNALEIRLNELYDAVDLFVISESTFTHSGKKKPLYLRENFYQIDNKFRNKLSLLSDSSKQLVKNPRIREMLQRERISKYLRTLNLDPKDLISHSDCDEIPRATTLLDLKMKSSESKIDAILELKNFANHINLSAGVWVRGRVQSYSIYKGIQNMRKDIFLFNSASQRRHSIPLIRIPDFWTTRRFGFHAIPNIYRKPNLLVISNAGWHFNNLFPKEEIIKKIESSCHVEWNTDAVRQKAIDNFDAGRDIYTGVQYKIVNIDKNYPAYITDNPERWVDYVFKQSKYLS
jgi:beta-1,4-mannosyl-glycoprotein beta-1,4-N-acetylglucosaminyltransferase